MDLDLSHGRLLLGVIRPSKVIAKALSASFHLMVHRALPLPVGSSDLVAMYKHFNAACSLGKRARARTDLR